MKKQKPIEDEEYQKHIDGLASDLEEEQTNDSFRPSPAEIIYHNTKKMLEENKKIKVLNLYAGIGGNRKLWKNVEVTAIENNPQISEIYRDFFPDDEIIATDAHQYLLEHFKEFDFIWSSPPCQSHSSFRHNICVKFRGTEPVYPDLNLYQEIIFLQHYFNGKWVVENVNPYYKLLIPAKFIQRHYFWSNFPIPENTQIKKDIIREAQIPDLQEKYDFDLSAYKLENKRQILRNCVLPEIGSYIFQCAFGRLNQGKLPLT